MLLCFIHLYKICAKSYLSDLSPVLLESSSVTIPVNILLSSAPHHFLIHIINGLCATWLVNSLYSGACLPPSWVPSSQEHISGSSQFPLTALWGAWAKSLIKPCPHFPMGPLHSYKHKCLTSSVSCSIFSPDLVPDMMIHQMNTSHNHLPFHGLNLCVVREHSSRTEHLRFL